MSIFKMINFGRVCWILTLWLPTALIGQNIKVCTLIDKNSRSPVPYASISGGSFFIYSDIDGKFPLEDLPKGVIKISRLGYKSISITGVGLSDTLLMHPDPIILSEFAVSGNSTLFEVGYNGYKTAGTAAMNRQTGLGVFIENPGRNSRIGNVLVETRKNQKGDTYQIDFFEVGENGEPQNIFFTKEYISPTGRNELKINVANANLSIPTNGILVTINWKGNPKNPDDVRERIWIKMTRDLDQSYGYIFYQNIWGKFDPPQLDYKLNYKIGLEMRLE